MAWKIKGEGSPIIEVWEDFQGNLWFVAEKEADGDICYGYARLYHMPEYAEWGSFSLKEIREAQRSPLMVWQVDKKNWSNIDTYENGLLVEVDD